MDALTQFTAHEAYRERLVDMADMLVNQVIISVNMLFVYKCRVYTKKIYLKTGNGGDAGHQTVHARRVQGKMELKTCRGVGGQAAKNGFGGTGKSRVEEVK